MRLRQIVGFRDTQAATVAGVEMFRSSWTRGLAGDNAGLLLRVRRREGVERGVVLAKPGSITPHTCSRARFTCCRRKKADVTPAFFNGYRPQFYFRTDGRDRLGEAS